MTKASLFANIDGTACMCKLAVGKAAEVLVDIRCSAGFVCIMWWHFLTIVRFCDSDTVKRSDDDLFSNAESIVRGQHLNNLCTDGIAYGIAYGIDPILRWSVDDSVDSFSGQHCRLFDVFSESLRYKDSSSLQIYEGL